MQFKLGLINYNQKAPQYKRPTGYRGKTAEIQQKQSMSILPSKHSVAILERSFDKLKNNMKK
jgi:hypothetical protein